MSRTVVSFHAHPDDEALLTGGTLAKLAAADHRVVIVTATDGAAGLSSSAVLARGDLGRMRLAELDRAAAALGAHRVVCLGYVDGAFSDVPVPQAAARLAQLLREEDADLLTGYDQAGGYGHPDHVHVHHVAREAARLTGTRLVEATIDRRRLLTALRLLGVLERVPWLLSGSLRMDPGGFATSYSDPAVITHCIDVGAHLGAKTAALSAHNSQTLGASQRTVGLLLRLPHVALRPVLGREWFVEVGRAAGGPKAEDLFDTTGTAGPRPSL